MISIDEIQPFLTGRGDVIGRDGKRIGPIGQIFLDERTGEPHWITTVPGHFGHTEAFVPLTEARVDGEAIHVPYDRDVVKHSPRVDDADGRLTAEGEDELYSYYGLLPPGAGPADPLFAEAAPGDAPLLPPSPLPPIEPTGSAPRDVPGTPYHDEDGAPGDAPARSTGTADIGGQP